MPYVLFTMAPLNSVDGQQYGCHLVGARAVYCALLQLLALNFGRIHNPSSLSCLVWLKAVTVIRHFFNLLSLVSPQGSVVSTSIHDIHHTQGPY